MRLIFFIFVDQKVGKNNSGQSFENDKAGVNKISVGGNMGKIFYRIVPFLLISLLSLVLNVSWAGDKPVSDIDSFLKEAVASNTEILSAKKAFESAAARIPQAASLSDPMIEYEYDKITDADTMSGEAMKTFAVSQDIPFPTKLYLRAKIASRIAKMAYENYQAKERDVIARVKSAYAELFLVQKSMEINQGGKAILENLYKNATTRYSAGKASQTDALKAQVELSRIDNELILLEQKRRTAQARLNVLLNKNPNHDVGILSSEQPVKFSRSLEDYFQLALDNNPELKAYRYAVKRGESAYALSLNEFAPDLKIKFKQQVDQGRTEEGHWAGMIGVTIPLWFFEKQAFGVKEMKADLDRVRAEYKGKENAVLFDVTDAYARADANKKLIELYEAAFIPQAQEAVNVAVRGYEAQTTNISTVLESQRMFLSFKLEHYQVILDFRTALADLERAVGVGIENIDGDEISRNKEINRNK